MIKKIIDWLDEKLPSVWPGPIPALKEFHHTPDNDLCPLENEHAICSVSVEIDDLKYQNNELRKMIGELTYKLKQEQCKYKAYSQHKESEEKKSHCNLRLNSKGLMALKLMWKSVQRSRILKKGLYSPLFAI